MSISVYTGLPRSGKSYSVVEVIIEALRKGREVYTNIPLELGVFEAELGAKPIVFSSQDIIDQPDWFDVVLPAGALLVLDECWRFWPSGMKDTGFSESHKEFLRMHGHRVSVHGFTSEIILISQDCADFAAFVRRVVDKTFRCTKLDSVGQSNRFRMDIYQGGVTGQNPPKSRRIREIYYVYKPEVYKFYKSSTFSESGSVGDESRSDSRANLLKGTKLKVMVVAVVVLPIICFIGFYHLYDFYFHKNIKNPGGVAGISSTSAGGVKSVSVPIVFASPLHGRKISIISVMDRGNGNEYVFRVADGDNSSRFTQMELLSAGYSVVAISECMVKVVGFGETFFPMCRGSKSVGVIAQAFQPANGDEKVN